MSSCVVWKGVLLFQQMSTYFVLHDYENISCVDDMLSDSVS